ncbi:hypothetical protein QBC35DRAFT_502997 [Podospora australis]|uniref:FAD-binding FR-type domain-containing protein n=1 Tax=Podospora australis TaxID=1536484 RepID=A0AAN6WPD1_9PEZI|nr:hypothetical protein QBC35DRAFT_502997 [Podospora australis]
MLNHTEIMRLCAQNAQLLPRFARAIYCSDVSTLSGEGGLPDDPEKLEYLRQLIIGIFVGRAVIASYNLFAVAAILVFTLLHWRESRRNWRRWRELVSTKTRAGEEDEAASSSSSTLSPGTATPVTIKDIDVERLPLLPTTTTKAKPSLINNLHSGLLYQPAPIPLINRVLPSNGTSLFILSWLALNVFLQLYLCPFHWNHFFVFADRLGFLFIVNLPLLYLLSAKNQPLLRLTGYSYEALNIFHRRVGEMMCLIGALHFLSMVIWQFFIAEDWLLASQSPKAYFTHPLILNGLAALGSYELLFFTSLGSFRQRWYELFLATHVILQIAALGFLWFHFYTSRPYVTLALVIFLVDRVVWRLTLKRVGMTADLTVLDGETFLVSANWDISKKGSGKGIMNGWEPTDHVFLTVPALGRGHSLQAHPFTIASAAPGRLVPASSGQGQDEEEREAKHAWFTLLIRAHDGFTSDLLRYAQQHTRVEVILDGPYGSPHALSMLRASRSVMLVAGGSGIAVTFPLVWALLHEDEPPSSPSSSSSEDVKGVAVVGKRRGQRERRKVHMLWVTHSRHHRNWIPADQLDELVARGLELVIPEPTAEAGRPDVAGLVGRWIDEADEETSVLVSGPDGLNRTVRNVCAGKVKEGRRVEVMVEKFGW